VSAVLRGAALLLLAGCDRGPEPVADRFVDAYFIHASQQVALELATGLAAQKLREELSLVSAVRAGGYTAGEARGHVRASRGEVRHEGGAVQIRYDLVVESAAGAAPRRALVTLRQAAGAWRVTNWSLFEGTGSPGPRPK
jgi:hypothetical protein